MSCIFVSNVFVPFADSDYGAQPDGDGARVIQHRHVRSKSAEERSGPNCNDDGVSNRRQSALDARAIKYTDTDTSRCLRCVLPAAGIIRRSQPSFDGRRVFVDHRLALSFVDKGTRLCSRLCVLLTHPQAVSCMFLVPPCSALHLRFLFFAFFSLRGNAVIVFKSLHQRCVAGGAAGRGRRAAKSLISCFWLCPPPPRGCTALRFASQWRASLATRLAHARPPRAAGTAGAACPTLAHAHARCDLRRHRVVADARQLRGAHAQHVWQCFFVPCAHPTVPRAASITPGLARRLSLLLTRCCVPPKKRKKMAVVYATPPPKQGEFSTGLLDICAEPGGCGLCA